MAVVLLGVAALATTAPARPGRQPLPPIPTPGGALPPIPAPPAVPVVLRVGDTMQVEGGSLGCQVTRRSGRIVIECRPAGKLRGRYGTFLSDRTATVARFRSSRTAQVVFTARHGAGWRVCGTPRRATASRSCR
jgi:hypothetical protein